MPRCWHKAAAFLRGLWDSLSVFGTIEMKYIEINNWEKFQHYKDRRPKWIKLLIEIIDEFDENGDPKKFYTLPDAAKLTFICLICFRAHFNNHIPYKSVGWLREKLGIQEIDLESLEGVGYISIKSDMYQDDTEMIQKRPKGLPPEREGETEREKEPPPPKGGHFSKLVGEHLEKFNSLGWKLEVDFPKIWEVIQIWLRQEHHPELIIEVLESVLPNLYRPDIKDKRAYLYAVMKIKAQNFREKDFIKEHEDREAFFKELVNQLRASQPKTKNTGG